MSKPAANDTPLQSTKQMLDELDALMDRMLSLPANDAESAPPIEPPQAPALSATLTMLEKAVTPPPPSAAEPPAALPMPPPGTPKAPRQRTEAWTAHAPTSPPHLALPIEAEEEPEEELEVLTNAPTPPNLLAKVEPLLAGIPTARPAAARNWIYGPLIGANQVFDGMTLILGPMGDWLRGAAGRALVGVTGIALLAASAVWLLKDWLGWQW